MSSDEFTTADQLKEITKSIISMASLDFESPPPIHGSGPLDAVAAGLIALNEELTATVVARDEAEHANETKTQFLANMSHELRTPLTSLIGGMELMAQSDLSDSQRKLLNQMQGAGERLFRLISDVLDFSKLEAGRLQLESRPLSPTDTIAGIVARYSKDAEAKGLALVSNHGTLPKLLILGDKQRIEQVLNNIVGNAIKYTEKGQVSIITRLHIHGPSVLLNVEVLDTGPGIDLNQQEQIFQRFVSADTSPQRRQDGAGLGLSIAKAITLEMKGELTLKSTPPDGSSFSFSISLDLAHRPSTEPPQKASLHRINHHILLVDDTEMVRAVTAKMLELLGCTVVTVESGREAIRIVESEDFDLILMDHQMPEMDGLETSRRLLELHPHRNLRIASITAYATLANVEKSKNAGLLGQLNKPFTLNEIETFILQLEADHPRHRN